MVWGNKISDGHSEEISNLVWDADDTGFATCGYDGKAFYWQINEEQQRLVEFINKEYKFVNVDIVPSQDESKHLLLADYNSIYDVTSTIKEKNEKLSSDRKDATKLLMRENVKEVDKNVTMCFSQLIYNSDSKMIIVALKKDHSPTIRFARYVINQVSNKNKSGDEEKRVDKKDSSLIPSFDIKEYQANSLGVSALRTSHDMSHLFTCGKDRCLFMFTIQGVQKQEKRDETLESDLLLVYKKVMDEKNEELKLKVNKIEEEMKKEEDNFKKIKMELEQDKREVQKNFENELARYTNEQDELQKKINSQTEYFEKELSTIRRDYKDKMDEMKKEMRVNLEIKNIDLKREHDNMEKEKKKDSDALLSLKKKINYEEKELREKYEKQLEALQEEIHVLSIKQEKITAEIEVKKEEKIESNDTKITKKRKELEKLKHEYIIAENQFKKEREDLEKQITVKKENINKKLEKKFQEKKTLQNIQDENEKLNKQIRVIKYVSFLGF